MLIFNLKVLEPSRSHKYEIHLFWEESFNQSSWHQSLGSKIIPAKLAVSGVCWGIHMVEGNSVEMWDRKSTSSERGKWWEREVR